MLYFRRNQKLMFTYM